MRIALILLLISLLIITTVLFLGHRSAPASSEGLASSIVSECANAPYRPFCYEEKVPQLIDNLTTVEIFDVVRLIRKKDPEYLFCHVLAHKIGENEVKRDPDAWLDALALAPEDGLCSNGYAHGAILARFNSEVFNDKELREVEDKLSIACESRAGWNPTDLQKAICYHGLGHVLVHLTNAEVDRALRTCERIAVKEDGRDYRRVCHEGVYMQFFQPLEPEDYALIDQLAIKPNRENIESFCHEYSSSEAEFGVCWREAWPFFTEELKSGEGIMKYCGFLKDQNQNRSCLITAFTINGRQNLANEEKMAQVCSALPKMHQGSCFARGANAFIEEDQGMIPDGVAFCSLAEDNDAKNECFGFLAKLSSFNLRAGSVAYETLCSTLPVQWQNTCRGEK